MESEVPTAKLGMREGETQAEATGTALARLGFMGRGGGGGWLECAYVIPATPNCQPQSTCTVQHRTTPHAAWARRALVSSTTRRQWGRASACRCARTQYVAFCAATSGANEAVGEAPNGR